MTLTQVQAEAVYSAMCALSNVGARLDKITLASGELYVSENEAGRVLVNSLESGDEVHFDQSAFATAYGLLPLLGGELTVRADGEPNRYTVIRDGNCWTAAVQLNGQLTVDRQQAIMARFVAALQA